MSIAIQCGFASALQGTVIIALPLFMLSASVFAAPEDKHRWNLKYGSEAYIYGKEPIAFLQDNIHLLPKGRTLDIAMGEGRNGVFLATKGFQVTGLDISEGGLEKAHQLAAERGVTITTRVVDLERYQLKRNTYEVVLCSYYLQRDLVPQIKAALKHGGMAVVETYTLEHRNYRPGFPKQYMLDTNELLEIFKDFKIIRYQAIDNGKKAYASIMAQKR